MKVQDITGFRNILRKLERELDSQLQAGVICCGVSLVQCHTLMELDKQDKTNLKDLATAMELDKSTVSRGIDSLVKQELVHRETDSDNRRFIILSLTPKGKNICREINRFCDQYYLELFRNIPEDKHQQVIESLSFFAEALSAVKKQKKITCNNFSCMKENMKEDVKEDMNEDV